MMEQKQRGLAMFPSFLVAIALLASGNGAIAKTPGVLSSQIARSPAGIKKNSKQDDSFNLKPAADLALHPEDERKAAALVDFVEGMAFEENGEMDRALEAYRKVLNVDPGQSDLATRVAALLIRQDDFPQAIDVLKDAIKANPNDAEPYRQLAFIYAKYLKKTDQAVEYEPGYRTRSTRHRGLSASLRNRAGGGRRKKSIRSFGACHKSS
jgi:tetratricopeptide (TPR) repeat protein